MHRRVVGLLPPVLVSGVAVALTALNRTREWLKATAGSAQGGACT